MATTTPLEEAQERAAALQAQIDAANTEIERPFLGNETAVDRLRAVAAALTP